VSAYRIISAERASFPVSVMCEVLGVSKSGFHSWERWAPSDRALSDAWLTSRIKEIHENARGVYGSRRVRAELRLGQDVVVSRKRIRRLMRQAGISGLVKVKKGRTTIRVSGVRVADDLVERNFGPDAPNVLWVADITYLRTWEGWLYLAAVQDAYSRRIVGWAMTEHMRTELVADALQMAVARRRPEPGLIHHSDQGSQYVALGFGQQARDAGIGLDGIQGRRLRQRRRRELLRDDQEGARPPTVMAIPTGSELGRVRVHRGLLQPPKTTLNARIPLPRGIRERAADNDQTNLSTKARSRSRNGCHSRKH
jgi:putative transposase